MGFPGGASGKKPACRCRRCKRCELNPESESEKEMATCSSILAWKTPWMEEPGGLQSMGVLESDMTEPLSTHNE